ncbi:histidine kinase dimerization/phospho-acceptor domain-containing protein [Chamaesiphon sp.]|uniref:GAF domain-containing sensor histidine kinase n=1 Tax=Chamaesiphon sp. TaxID=2814140 RepID=UPI0035947886
MLNSAQDLDISPNSHVAKSTSPPSSSLMTELSSEPSPAMPIFSEATAQAIRLTDTPVAILTTIAGAGYQIGSISGLEQCHLPPNANLRLELGGLEYCHDRTISTNSNFYSVTNCRQHPQLAQSSLCQTYRIQAYLGVPIITAAGDRLGTIAILDFKPRHFSDRDIDLLQLVSRLVASEFERKLLSQAQLTRWLGDLQERAIAGFDDLAAAAEHSHPAAQLPPELPSASSPADMLPIPTYPSVAYPQVQTAIQFKLLTHLAQELRTPLTAVLGMASVLQQEIYGPLSSKQKDYLGIIHHSGCQLVTIVDEISQLGGCDFQQHHLMLKSVDLEMLCQLAIQSLEPLAHKKQQQIVLNLGDATAPAMTSRMWLLDKDKVRQIVYYLCLSLIHASTMESEISIRLTDRADGLQIQIATNDPHAIITELELDPNIAPPLSLAIATTTPSHTTETQLGQLRIGLGLSLSHSLAASHGGNIEVTIERRGYQLTLPLIIADRPSAPI